MGWHSQEGPTIKAVILAGGLGTRLAEETATRPKPMVEVGGRPILWHIMKIYAHHGITEFVICLGYRAEVIKEYFLGLFHRSSDFTVNLTDNQVQVHQVGADDWEVTLVDTGLHTQTGGRLLRVREFVGPGTFLMTYGDGVADVDLTHLLAFHRGHGRLATLTAVRPQARFGTLELDGDRVLAFSEKPPGAEGWINGGFFVLEPGVFDYLGGDQTVFEREPLERLAREGQLMVHRHEGFWQCMDTLRDVRNLGRLWDSGSPPWKVWS